VWAETEAEVWAEEIRNACKFVAGKYRRDVLGIPNVGQMIILKLIFGYVAGM
jgi:hypothetical protein